MFKKRELFIENKLKTTYLITKDSQQKNLPQFQKRLLGDIQKCCKAKQYAGAHFILAEGTKIIHHQVSANLLGKYKPGMIAKHSNYMNIYNVNSTCNNFELACLELY